MDDVETVRDLPLYFPDVNSFFRIHPDPVINRFRGGKKIYKGEALILTVSFRARCGNCTAFIVFFANDIKRVLNFALRVVEVVFMKNLLKG